MFDNAISRNSLSMLLLSPYLWKLTFNHNHNFNFTNCYNRLLFELLRLALRLFHSQYLESNLEKTHGLYLYLSPFRNNLI